MPKVIGYKIRSKNHKSWLGAYKKGYTLDESEAFVFTGQEILFLRRVGNWADPKHHVFKLVYAKD